MFVKMKGDLSNNNTMTKSILSRFVATEIQKNNSKQNVDLPLLFHGNMKNNFDKSIVIFLEFKCNLGSAGKVFRSSKMLAPPRVLIHIDSKQKLKLLDTNPIAQLSHFFANTSPPQPI